MKNSHASPASPVPDTSVARDCRYGRSGCSKRKRVPGDIRSRPSRISAWSPVGRGTTTASCRSRIDCETGLRLHPDAPWGQGRGRNGGVIHAPRHRPLMQQDCPQDPRRQALSLRQLRHHFVTSRCGRFLRLLQRASARWQRKAHRIARHGLRFRDQGRTARGVLDHQPNKSCGTFVTPYLPGKFRPTPIRNDGTRYDWTLDYDPQAAGGNGRFTFTLRSDNAPVEPVDASLPEESRQEAHSRFPHTTTFTVDLTPGFKTEGASYLRPFWRAQHDEVRRRRRRCFSTTCTTTARRRISPKTPAGSASATASRLKPAAGRRAQLRLQREDEPRGRCARGGRWRPLAEW